MTVNDLVKLLGHEGAWFGIPLSPNMGPILPGNCSQFPHNDRVRTPRNQPMPVSLSDKRSIANLKRKGT